MRCTVRKIGYLIVLIALCIACEPETSCHEDMTAGLNVNIMAAVYLSDSTYQLNIPDSLTVGMVGTDSLMANNVHDQSKFKFELRPDSNQTQLWILYHDKIDTITVFHTPMMHYVSMACGSAIMHEVDSFDCSEHSIDSVFVVNTDVRISDDENMEVWLLK